MESWEMEEVFPNGCNAVLRVSRQWRSRDIDLGLARAAAGGEIEGPMAIVILGGLLTSTALNLLVLPVMALRLGQFRRSPAA